MPSDSPQHYDERDSGRAYRAGCSCGWEIERGERDANLSRETNKKLVRKVAECHETRPRFGEAATETHTVSDVTVVGD